MIKVGITVGDINGIGIEIILKSLYDNRMLENITPIIYGSNNLLSYQKKALNLKEFNFNKLTDYKSVKNSQVYIKECWNENPKVKFGAKNADGGKYAYNSLKAAVQDMIENKIDVLVTAPINKESMQNNGFEFPGHTEYLGKLSNVEEPLMFMVSESLKIATVTGHIPLKDVPTNLTKDKIARALNTMNDSLSKDFGILKPKIAVLGLNPHAGESGKFGDEESEVIIPAINQVKNKGIMAFGPYPADSFFSSENLKNFDAVLGMYHDQSLTPFKTIAFENGVNYTAGLPIVRTSPDHGTAFDIAGQGIANESSFRHAIYTAIDIYKNRSLHKEMSSNPLKKQDQHQQ